MSPSTLEQHRYFLKDSIRLTIDFSQTDQSRGVPAPPIEKPYGPDAIRMDLPPVGQWRGLPRVAVEDAIRQRRSRRDFSRKPLTVDEISFLLWATQGVREVLDSGTAFRTVPSAGSRHAFETHLAVLNVEGIEAGFYRYLPLEHQLLFEFQEANPGRRLAEAALGQWFVARAAAVFCWTAVPYRMEWRYGLAAHKVILLDAGHVCQNLYLACETIDAGACAIAAYHQERMDRLLRVDGQEEFTIYLAAVGKV